MKRLIIGITDRPFGNVGAPLEILDAWVGIQLPVNYTRKKVAGGCAQTHRKFIKRRYYVSPMKALEALLAAGKSEAALWYLKNHPRLFSMRIFGLEIFQFIFSSDCAAEMPEENHSK